MTIQLERIRSVTTYATIVGGLIGLLRKEANVEQAVVAKAAGLKTQSTMSRIEAGKSNLTVTQLWLIARTLNTTPAIILTRADQAAALMAKQGVDVYSGKATDLRAFTVSKRELKRFLKNWENSK